MITASKLAGFFAAHAIWSVSEANAFDPMLAYTLEDEKRNMDRIIHKDGPPGAVEYGRQKLESNKMDANDGVLVFDGRITWEGEKLDAVVIEMRAYFSPAKAVIAVPYTPKDSGKFLVHKPKILQWENCEDFDMQRAIQSFFEGVDEHEQGSKIWNAALDQTK